jgi:hypothetical protein
MLKKQPGGMTITTEDAVKSMLQDLGHESMTYGNVRHEIPMAFMHLIPDFIWGPVVFSQAKKLYKK